MASGSHQFFVCQLINRWISDWNISLQSPKPTTLKKQWWTRAAAFCRIMPRETTTTTTLVQSSKMQNFSLWAVKWRIDFFCCSSSTTSFSAAMLAAPHSHLMVHRVVMKLWFVIFLQLHCCKTCRILTAQTQCCFRTWIRCLEPLNWKRYKKLARLALKVGFQASRQAFQDNEKVSPFAV